MMTLEEAISIIERVIHTEAKWPGTEDTLEALDMAITALRPISRGQIEQSKRRWEVQTSIFPYYYCSGCGESFEIHSYDKEKYRFCPYCMAPMTDEAVEMVMERMEALKDA